MRMAVFLLALLTGCDRRPDQWDAFIYPDAHDLSAFEQIKGFKTFELCQAAAIDRLRRVQKDGGGDFECGYKCAPAPGMDDLNICKETRK